MTAKEHLTEKLSFGCSPKKACGSSGENNSYRNFIEGEWEVFVVKLDKATGKLVGKLACCALARV